MPCLGDCDEMIDQFMVGKQVCICVYCDRSTPISLIVRQPISTFQRIFVGEVKGC